MNPDKLKEGQLITCKDRYYLGTFSKEPFSEFITPYTPWLAVSSLDFTAHGPSAARGEWLCGVGEAIVYLGKSGSQLSLELVEIPGESQYKNVVQHHEVLWRGTVYRVRTGSFKRFKNFTARPKTPKLDGKKSSKKVQ